MRDYLSMSNVPRAAALSALVTVMAVGRLVEGQRPLALFIPVTFCAMMFVGGAVTAWGRHANPAGLFPGGRTLRNGLLLAVLLALLALPIHVYWLDPLFRSLLSGVADSSLARLAYPHTLHGALASMLWAAGFHTLFFVAAPMSLFARLTHRPAVALALTCALRAYVMHRQLATAGLLADYPVFLIPALAATAAGGFLFARYGLAPAMVLAAGIDARLLLYALSPP